MNKIEREILLDFVRFMLLIFPWMALAIAAGCGIAGGIAYGIYWSALQIWQLF